MGHGQEDIAPSVCGMRSALARLLRVSSAAPVLGRLEAVGVTESRVLPPPCVNIGEMLAGGICGVGQRYC